VTTETQTVCGATELSLPDNDARQMQIYIQILKMMISCRVKIPEDPVLSLLAANDLLVVVF
jgi:hypothetical protein